MKFPSITKRPAHTLLFITEVKTFRVDVDKAGVMSGHAEIIAVNCASPAKLAECINTIAAKSRPLGRKVWLLYIGLPINLLSIPSMQVEGVDEATLVQALQFELESLTGQPSQDMQLAYQLLSNKDEMSNYWVSQISQLYFEDVSKAVKNAGSHLSGLLHPAGLPLSLKNPDEQDWLRIECWSHQLVAQRKVPDDDFALQVLSFENRNWQTQLEKWLAQQGTVEHSETLLNNKIELLPDAAFKLHLNEVEPVAEWLLVWARALVKKAPPAVPVLRYQSKLNKDLLLMASGGSVALLICLGHFTWHLYQANYYTAEFAALQKVETAMTAQRKTLSADQDKRDKLKTKIDKLKADSETLPKLIKGLQDRPFRLLEALAKGRPENLLVESIATDKDEIKISGISLDSTSANELANYLETQLATLGWSFVAPAKKNLELLTGGGPWEFEIKLLDLGVDGFNKKPHD